MPKGRYKLLSTLSSRHRSRLINSSSNAIQNNLLNGKLYNDQSSSTDIDSDRYNDQSSSTEIDSDQYNEHSSSTEIDSDQYNEHSSSTEIDSDSDEDFFDEETNAFGCNEPQSDDIEIEEHKTTEDERFRPDIVTDETFDNLQANETVHLRASLARWTTCYGISKAAVNGLLKILKKHNCFKEIPSDSRTLLRTPRYSIVEEMPPGEYFHFGLESGIRYTVSREHDETLIGPVFKILINIDGLPLGTSTTSNFWPILGLISSLKNSKPFVIGIFHGLSKPKCTDQYLSSFITEASLLIEEGLTVNGIHKTVKITGFVCDTPARAFIRKVKGHNGYFGCDKCTQPGIRRRKRHCFPLVNDELRTDASFRNKSQAGHHHGTSLLEKLKNIDMVQDFPLDYMHLVCLGVVKKTLKLWMGAEKKNATFKFRPDQILEVSNRLESLAPVTCSEFVRKPRSLKDVDRFKATEFRQFLLYSGILVLKNILPNSHYELYRTLIVAIRILATPQQTVGLIDFAGELLKYFVQMYSVLYGKHLISYNVHCLLHLVKDCRKYGHLDAFSAFPFENYLYTLKSKIANTGYPLKQAINRITEERRISSCALNVRPKDFSCHMVHKEGPLLDGCVDPQFKKIILADFQLSISQRDHCCILSDLSIVVIENIVSSEKDPSKMILVGRKFKSVENYFTSPCPSSKVGVFRVKTISALMKWPLSEVSSKAMKYPLNNTNEFLVMQLLHNTCSD